MSQPTLPIRMLHDRVLVEIDEGAGERRSGGGILIPSTVTMGKRLAWAKVVASGPNVRAVELGDRVLFDPEEECTVDVDKLHGKSKNCPFKGMTLKGRVKKTFCGGKPVFDTACEE